MHCLLCIIHSILLYVVPTSIQSHVDSDTGTWYLDPKLVDNSSKVCHTESLDFLFGNWQLTCGGKEIST